LNEIDIFPKSKDNKIYFFEDRKLILESFFLKEEPNVSTYRWEKLREVACELPTCSDEHVFLLLHVLHARGLMCVDARVADLYKRAARTVIETDRFSK